MDILAVTNQILMMLIIMGIGLLLRRSGVLSTPVIQGLSGIVLKAAMPAMLLMMVQQEVEADIRGEFLRIMLTAFVWYCLALGLIFWLARKKMPEDRAPVFAGLSAMPNVGFMGLPIIQTVYGERGALYLAAVIVAFNLCMYLLVELMMTGKPPRPSVLARNIGLLISLFAVFSVLFDLRLPEPLPAVCKQLGSVTIPLSLLSAGARLTDFRPAALKQGSLWLATFLRLLALPLLGNALFRLLGFGGMPLGVMTIACAMPGAASTQMYAEREGKDALFAATGISLGMLLCLGSIPLVLMLTGIG